MSDKPNPYNLVLGHDIPYWTELQRRLEEGVPNGSALLEEIVMLRGRLTFYESRIQQMAEVMGMGKK